MLGGVCNLSYMHISIEETSVCKLESGIELGSGQVCRTRRKVVSG